MEIEGNLKSPMQSITYLGTVFGYSAICGDQYKVEILIKNFEPTAALSVGVALASKGYFREETSKYWVQI